MAYNHLASLTPSRPAPTPPSRPQANSFDKSASIPLEAKSSAFSSTAYTSSFPILRDSSVSSPSKHPARPSLVRSGLASVKEEGLRSFLWSKRWLVLSDSELSIFKNEVSA